LSDAHDAILVRPFDFNELSQMRQLIEFHFAAIQVIAVAAFFEHQHFAIAQAFQKTHSLRRALDHHFDFFSRLERAGLARAFEGQNEMLFIGVAVVLEAQAQPLVGRKQRAVFGVKKCIGFQISSQELSAALHDAGANHFETVHRHLRFSFNCHEALVQNKFTN